MPLDDPKDGALPSSIGGIVRHLMTGFGMALAAGGYLLEGQVETFAGIGVAVAGVVWSLWQKHRAAQKLAAAKENANA